MRWNQIYSEEGRRSFTTGLFGAIALSFLIGFFFSGQADTAVKLGMLVSTLITLLLIFFLHRNVEYFKLIGASRLLGSFTVEVTLAADHVPVKVTLQGEHKPVETVVGYIPDRNKSEEVTEEERDLSDELKVVVGDEWSPSTARTGLDLLARHESLVQRSWTHLLNRARLLHVVNQTAEAEALVWAVIKRFSISSVAVGTAYEVLSWIEEFREPKERGALYEQWLNRRWDYVMKGLQHFPTGHDLLMNAFEVATLRHDADEALSYLNKAASVDQELTQKNLAVNPRTRKAMRLSPEMKRTIRGLIKGENEMDIFRTLKFKLLAVLMAGTLCAVSGAAYRQAAQTPHGSPDTQTALTAPLARAASAARQMCKTGTSIGKAGTGLAKAGTSIGHQ